MAYLLDTNTVIDARDGVRPVLRKMIEHHGEVVVSALGLAELQRGLVSADGAYRLARRQRLEALMAYLPVSAFGRAQAEAYGEIVKTLGWVRGRDFDRMIGARDQPRRHARGQQLAGFPGYSGLAARELGGRAMIDAASSLRTGPVHTGVD